MTDTEFETLVDQLFDKHCLRLGGDHWAEGDDGLDLQATHLFAKELKEVLETQRNKV